jgi:1,4-alpha-glucan branching enzyme
LPATSFHRSFARALDRFLHPRPARKTLVLSPTDLTALCEARHGDPFAVLGLHADDHGQWWLRALLPGARAVTAVDPATLVPLAALVQHESTGLFEAALGRQRRPYRLQVVWADGSSGTYADAYAFGAALGEQDVYFLGEGSHLRPYEALGAHLQCADDGGGAVDGTRFAVWAPNASRVSVVGDFNGWDGRRHPMRVRHGVGVWEIFIPHVGAGDRYKFEIRAADGRVLPHRADPFAFESELRPATASVVASPVRRALPADRHNANRRDAPVSIYEVHLGSWRRKVDENGNGNTFLDWDALAAQLPAYAADLGFTHIELLPVAEHPFDGSWGYQVLGLYAPTARFGPPAGFARFIDACHASGLGVIIDWVPAHFPADAHGLAQFDGTALYEYADTREGFHQDWNTLIYNFGRTEVRNFLVGNALYWLERFGVDGLRVDAVASMLYRDYSRQPGQWVPNVHGGRENLEAIDFLKRMNEIVGREAQGTATIAEESTAWPGVSRPTSVGGLGFHYKWNMGWMHDTLQYMHKDPIHRRWHHNELTFSLLYAFDENFVLPLSHDEVVHGKGSLLAKMPGDRWQQFANLRAYFGWMWTHPGKKLLFMGCEFAQNDEWNHDRSLDWHLLQHPEHRGVQALVRDLNHLYRDHPALHALDCEPGGFEWIEANDAEHSCLAFLRHGGGSSVLVAANFTPMPRESMRLGVPDAWRQQRLRELLNTDSAHYGGANIGNGARALVVEPITAHGRTQSVLLTLPPLAVVVLTVEPAA